MSRTAYRAFLWSIVCLGIAAPVGYVLAPGWAHTNAPVAQPVSSGGLLINLYAHGDVQASRGRWPIVYTTTYPDVGPITGYVRDRTDGCRADDYRITLTSRDGVTTQVRCNPVRDDVCLFRADLGRSDLTKGLTVSVMDAGTSRTVVQPQTVMFTRKSSYSLALWDGLMGV